MTASFAQLGEAEPVDEDDDAPLGAWQPQQGAGLGAGPLCTVERRPRGDGCARGVRGGEQDRSEGQLVVGRAQPRPREQRLHPGRRGHGQPC